VGALGCLLAYPLALRASLVVVLGLLLVGLGAGLAMAKWLEWGWYGRQFEAGLKAGMFACVPAALAALLALLAQGPHDVAELADRSRLGPLDLAPVARALGFLNWGGVDLVGALVGGALAVGVATLATWAFAFSKSTRAVQVIAQAHQAAQALRRGTWGPSSAPVPVPSFPSMLAVGAQWQGATSQQATVTGGAPWGGAAQPPSAGDFPSMPTAPSIPLPAQAPAVHAPPAATAPPSRPPQGVPAPAGTPLDDEQLRAAMREALAMWGDESGVHGDEAPGRNGQDDQPTERRKRPAKGSRFLNDSAGGKKRGRKKSETRDWLC